MQLTGNGSRTESTLDSLLSSVWNANLPIMLDRLERLDAFASAALCGEVTPQQRSDALNIAHKLAGSLGIFGFAAAGKVAQTLELLLRSQEPLNIAELESLSASLRSALDL